MLNPQFWLCLGVVTAVGCLWILIVLFLARVFHVGGADEEEES